MAAIQGRQRIGDKQLGVLFDGGKVRRRRAITIRPALRSGANGAA